jgi:uncharacterized lipoprotein YmbA
MKLDIKTILAFIAIAWMLLTSCGSSRQYHHKQYYELVPARDYQISIHNDTLWLFEGKRFVGRVVDTLWNSPLNNLILFDNQ